MFARRCATVRKRSQPSATVRVRPVRVPMASVAKAVALGNFKPRVASFRVAGVALYDIPICFITCRKSSSVATAILWRRFLKTSCSFPGRRSTLDVSIVIFRGRRSTLDVSCCVFLQIALAGLRQVATRCKFRGRRDIL